MAGGALVLIGLISRFVGHQKAPTKPAGAAEYGSHGSGRWATPSEIEKAFPPIGAGALLGRIRKKEGWRPVIFPWISKTRNRFVLMIGPPGSGKTSRYTLPNLLHAAAVDRERSIICTDPKGELHRNTARMFQQAGFKVRVLNLANQTASNRYNPMDYVASVEDAMRLAATIVANTGGNHAGGDQFWVSSEKTLLACLIWYVKTCLPQADQHLGNVLHLGNAFAKDKEAMAAIFEALDPSHGARQLYGVIAALSDKTRDGVFVGFAVRLQLWASPQVVSLTSASDFRIEDLGQEPTVLYLIIPDADSTFRVISSLFFDQAFQRLIALADRSGGRLPVECRLMLEEMANIGRIPDLDKRLATIRSRGILVEMVLQTLGQLQAIYGEDWDTIVGCSDTLLVLAANDQKTAQYVSERLGTTTIRTTSQTTTRAQKGGSEGLSFHYTSRPLMLPDEVAGQGEGGLRQDELLLIQRGTPPARLEKFPVEESPWAEKIVQAEPDAYAAPERQPVTLVDVAKLVPKKDPPPKQEEPVNNSDAPPDWAKAN